MKKEALALEITQALDDMYRLPFHRKCGREHYEEYRLRQLAKVLAMPQHKILSIRARLRMRKPLKKIGRCSKRLQQPPTIAVNLLHPKRITGRRDS